MNEEVIRLQKEVNELRNRLDATNQVVQSIIDFINGAPYEDMYN